MPLSIDEAYDRAADKIWRAFRFAMLAPTPLIFFQAWLRQADRIALYLLLGMALFWCAVALPFFLIHIRRGFRARTIPLVNTSGLFCVPLLFLLRFPADIIEDCGGGFAWQLGAFAACGALFVLLAFWLHAVEKEYRAALPPEAPAAAPERSSAQERRTAPSGPSVI